MELLESMVEFHIFISKFFGSYVNSFWDWDMVFFYQIFVKYFNPWTVHVFSIQGFLQENVSKNFHYAIVKKLVFFSLIALLTTLTYCSNWRKWETWLKIYLEIDLYNICCDFEFHATVVHSVLNGWNILPSIALKTHFFSILKTCSYHIESFEIFWNY